MNTLPILNKNIGPPEMNVVGRLSHDFCENESKVVLKLTEAILKAHVVMGLNIDAQKVNLSAVESLKKIKDVYPHAWLDDVVKSLSMASYGEIKLDDQLSTISPANIFGWYKYFRNNLGHLSTAPPPPEKITMYQLSEQEKSAMMRKGFFAFISEVNENDTMMDVYYQKLINIGAFEVTDELKNSAYFNEADKMVQAPPIEYLSDRKIRKDLYAFQDYYKSVSDKKDFKFNTLSENFIHRMIVRGAKKRVVVDFLKKADKEKIMDLYDNYESKHKK
jgi:hypothetical protein